MKRKKIQIAKWGTPKKNNLRKAHQKKKFKNTPKKTFLRQH